jgi:ribonuclease P protein component
VGYAITRAYGPAVARNRLRRRWREILHELDATTPLPPGLLLLGPTDTTSELTFEQLRLSTVDLIAALTTEPRPSERMSRA